MTSTLPKLIVLAVLSALLNACTTVSPDNAPVHANYPEPPTPKKDDTKYHQVKKGDTLYAISLIYDLDYRQLAQWNQIAPPYTIEIGQKIRLSDPNPGNTPINDHMDTGAQRKTKQSVGSATAANRFNSQRKTAVSFAARPNLSYRSAYKIPPVNDSTAKTGSSPQKKPIISIDNITMLKLNFQWPIKGKILKSFSQEDNKGIDIAGALGQYVHATEGGKVVYSGQGLIGYGNLLIIKHNDMYLSAYANNSQLLVAEGYTVKKGEVIAKVGQTGANKTSLHFEIRKNGKPVNPLELLPEK
jgi:lipoprotein NlpD